MNLQPGEQVIVLGRDNAVPMASVGTFVCVAENPTWGIITVESEPSPVAILLENLRRFSKKD